MANSRGRLLMRAHSRREFLSRAFSGAVLAGTGSTLPRPLLGLAAQGPAPASVSNRGYAAGKFALELSGQFAGWINSVTGGQAQAVVGNPVLGAPRKQLATLKYDDITVSSGIEMSKTLFDWVKASFDKRPVAMNGAIVTCNYDLQERSRLDWSGALITEIDFPPCDANSKQPAIMSVKFAPLEDRLSQTNRSYAQHVGKQSHKEWIVTNFRLQIDGCPTASAHASQIQPVTAKFPSAGNHVVRGTLTSITPPPPMQVSDLVVTVPEASAGELYRWAKESASNGSFRGGNGTLQYLTPNLTDVLLTLTFRKLAIVRLTPLAASPKATLRWVRAEMSCQDLAFDYGPTAVG